MSDLPDPLTPPECDLRSFEYMPLEVLRLRDSSLAVNATGEEFRCAVLLWCASWHQVPAASLPNDERQLAQLAGLGRDVKAFKKVKTGAMHGWVLCNDNRWYHPVVAERAKYGWEERTSYKEKQEKRREAARIAAEARWHAEKEAMETQSQGNSNTDGMRNAYEAQCDSDTDDMRSACEAQCDTHDVRNAERERKGKGKGKERERDNIKNLSDPLSAGLGEAKPENHAKPVSTAARQSRATVARSSETWDAYANAYRRRYGADPVRNATVNGQLANFVKRIGQEEGPQVAAFYVDHSARLYVQAMHPLNLLVRDAEKLRTEWATGRIQTETRARNADRMAEQGAVWERILEANETRGGH